MLCKFIPRIRHVFAVLAFLLGWNPGMAQAQTLYGITFGGSLITINTATAIGTSVGAPLPGTPRYWGISFRAGNLYAFDETLQSVDQLNLLTGAIIGSTNMSYVGTEGDIAFRSDGVGFLTQNAAVPTGELAQFDVTTPNSVTVISSAVTPHIDGLAFNSLDVLYGIIQGGATLRTINTTTGVATL